MPALLADHVDVSAVGTVVRIVFPEGLDSAVRDRVRSVWADATITSASPDREIELSSTAPPDALLEDLSIRVTLAALEHQRGVLTMLHAAGIALDDGRVLAFVGPSGRGKTTLSSRLAREFGYVSDETVAVAPGLTVLPYRKPLSIVEPHAPKRQVAPSDAGLQALPPGELRLAALVLLDRAPDQKEPTIAPLALPDAIGDLVPQMSFLAEIDRPLQQLAAIVSGSGGVRVIRYAEAEDVVPLVSKIVSTRSDEDWRPLSWVSAPAGALRVATPDDAIEVDGRVIVLRGGIVRVLDGIAPEVWRALAAGRDGRGVVAAVIERFGPPPEGDAADIVASVVDELVRAGVLERQ